jgi:hypothetical protein
VLVVVFALITAFMVAEVIGGLRRLAHRQAVHRQQELPLQEDRDTGRAGQRDDLDHHSNSQPCKTGSKDHQGYSGLWFIYAPQRLLAGILLLVHWLLPVPHVPSVFRCASMCLGRSHPELSSNFGHQHRIASRLQRTTVGLDGHRYGVGPVQGVLDDDGEPLLSW